jgi:hypothetical protein
MKAGVPCAPALTVSAWPVYKPARRSSCGSPGSIGRRRRCKRRRYRWHAGRATPWPGHSASWSGDQRARQLPAHWSRWPKKPLSAEPWTTAANARARGGRRRRGQARPPPLRTPGPGLAWASASCSARASARTHHGLGSCARARLAVSHCQQLSITPPPPQNQPSPHTIASEASASPEARADVVGLALRSLDEAVDGHRHHQDDLPHRGSLRRGPGGSAAGAQPSAR